MRIPERFDPARKAGKGLLLYRQVMHLAEFALESLENRDGRKDLLRGKTACEEPHEVAQLLAGLAKLLGLVGMALQMDSGALGELVRYTSPYEGGEHEEDEVGVGSGRVSFQGRGW